jgi:hypothetical protein
VTHRPLILPDRFVSSSFDSACSSVKTTRRFRRQFLPSRTRTAAAWTTRASFWTVDRCLTAGTSVSSAFCFVIIVFTLLVDSITRTLRYLSLKLAA